MYYVPCYTFQAVSKSSERRQRVWIRGETHRTHFADFFRFGT